jgi:hypothetical protein
MVKTANFMAWARSGNLPPRESSTSLIQGLWITLPNAHIPRGAAAGLKAYLKLCCPPPVGDYLLEDKQSWPPPEVFKAEIRAADPVLTEDEVDQAYSMFRDKRWIGRRPRKPER